jgi:hypothetical protein
MLRTALLDFPPQAAPLKHSLLAAIVSRIYRRHALPLPSRATVEQSYRAQFPSYVVDQPTPDVRRAAVRVISDSHAVVMRVNRDRSVAYHTVPISLSLSEALALAGPSDPHATGFLEHPHIHTPAAYGVRAAHDAWLSQVIRAVHPSLAVNLPLASDDNEYEILLANDLFKLSRAMLTAGDLKVLAFLRQHHLTSLALYNWLVVPDPSGQRRRFQAAQAFPAFVNFLTDLPADAIEQGEPLIPLLASALEAACPSPFQRHSSPKAAVRHLNHVLHHDLLILPKPRVAANGTIEWSTLTDWQPTAQALLTALPHERYPNTLNERTGFCTILHHAIANGLRDPDVAGALEVVRSAPSGCGAFGPYDLISLANWHNSIVTTCVVTPTLLAQGLYSPSAVATLSKQLRHRMPFKARLACSQRLFQPFGYATFLRQLEQLKVKPVVTDEPWLPLSPPKLYDGYLFLPVTRHKLLQRLGRHQQHCAGDYHQACREGVAHFVVVVKQDVLPPLGDTAAIDSEALLAELFSVSARQPQQRFITCHLTLRPDQVVALSDARGFRNGPPSSHVRDLIQRYLFDLNHDEELRQPRAQLLARRPVEDTSAAWPFTLESAPSLYALARDYLPHIGPPSESAADWLTANGIAVAEVMPGAAVMAAE